MLLETDSFPFDAKCLILDNLTTEIEKLCYEVYENCYRNESELEDDVKSEIDIEMIDGQDEKKLNQNSPCKVHVYDLNVMYCITMYIVVSPFYRYDFVYIFSECE